MTEQSGRESADEDAELGSGSKKWPAFPNDNPFLVRFRAYLSSRHGQSRSNNEGMQISTEVAKYLYFADASTLQEKLLSCML